MKGSVVPSFKSISLENPKLILQLPKLTPKSRRILKVCSSTAVHELETQYARTRTLATMPSTSECNWQESFRVSLSGGDLELIFEIFEEHAFGYNPEELISVWTGKIPVQAYFGDIKQFDVFGNDLQKVGSLWVRLKTFSDGIKFSEPKPIEIKTEEIIAANPMRAETVQSAMNQSIVRNESDQQEISKQVVAVSTAAPASKPSKQLSKAGRSLNLQNLQSPSL